MPLFRLGHPLQHHVSLMQESLHIAPQNKALHNQTQQWDRRGKVEGVLHLGTSVGNVTACSP